VKKKLTEEKFWIRLVAYRLSESGEHDSNIRQEKRSQGKNSNPLLPEYEETLLPTMPRRSDTLNSSIETHYVSLITATLRCGWDV